MFSLLFVSSKSTSQALLLEDYDLGIQNEWFFQSTPGHAFCIYSCEDVLSCYLFQLMQLKMSNITVAGNNWRPFRGAVCLGPGNTFSLPNFFFLKLRTVCNDYIKYSKLLLSVTVILNCSKGIWRYVIMESDSKEMNPSSITCKMCDLRQIPSFVKASTQYPHLSKENSNRFIILHDASVRLSEQVHVKCLHMPRYMVISHYWLALIILSQHPWIPLGI